MTAPVRIQLSRRKGWRMPENTVSVARPGIFGNPWTVADARAAGYSKCDTVLAAWCKSLFRDWLLKRDGITEMLVGGKKRRERLLAELPRLRGKNLACWCHPSEPCHADVLLELANAPATISEEG
ncbi:DUF4326 domain-containing protein [Sphingomonas oryzagri]|uniref:DUF4326 domain-containing protein n=1 Tax=Sphingomonas oryzagri TaxID=3042314 RepID=A0ABT6N0U3_9SPHN|nr:DUF4326 domain-containing protein [Sphingomonas oryzagri]MDH7638918.1 DUF4326 domain-containing protein [Sphingomonas oryzagri]